MGRAKGSVKLYEGYDKTVIDFITSQKKGTQHVYKSFFKLVLKYAGMTGEQLLASKKADKDFEWEKKTVAFKQWMKNQKSKTGKNYSDNATNTAVNSLRSFFDYYRTPLQLSQNENRKLGGKAQRVTKDYMLMNEDIAKLVFVGDLREKYIVLLGKSFGLRAGDFASITYGMFRSINLSTEAPVFFGDFQTQKEGVIAKPFIDADALPVVKAVLEANQNKPNDERIIPIQEEELSSILQALAKKANINLGDKHLRFHCFRKYLIDRLSGTTSESKWKQIVGKAVSEDAYVSGFGLRDDYSKVMKLTTINGNGNGKVTKLGEEVTKLQKEIEDLKPLQQQFRDLKNNFDSLVSALEEMNLNPKKIMKQHQAKYSEGPVPEEYRDEDPEE
jgi:integrase